VVNREEKATQVAELHERFSSASVALVTTNLGLTVAQANALRRAMKSVKAEYKVAKHTLVKRALADTRYVNLEKLLEGPRTLVFGYDDPVSVAKALVAFAEQNNKIQVDGGALEGQLMRAEQVKALATMPSANTLRARVVRQAMSPGTRLASLTRAPAQRLAGAIAALVKKLEEGGASA
jgi:large subunit ribosomal protein L10